MTAMHPENAAFYVREALAAAAFLVWAAAAILLCSALS